VLLVLGAFVLGSVPFGVVIARWRGVRDLQQRGSGNIGATNVARVIGIGPGLAVLALDAGKGAAAIALARHAGAAPGLVAACGLAVIAGHCFSPILRFRGGKGVATSLGVFGVLAPALALIAVAAFALVAGKTRVPALGSLAGSAALALAAVASGAPSPVRVLALATFALLVFTHRGNLAKLRSPRAE
jgi:glycerol-3-phosphate acyltransferase PlsY